MRILPLLILSATVFYSCDKKAETAMQSSEVTTPMSDSAVVNEAVSTNKSAVEKASPDGTANVTASNTGAKPALNPEHGQPYHRCEIPVGAPIDSAPPQNPAPQVVPQQNGGNTSFNTNPISPSVSPVPSAPVQASGPKPALNPAHGEPHHRCDLQVGAPLT